MKNQPAKINTVTENDIANAINSRFEEVKNTANQLRMQMLGVGFTLVQAEIELKRMGKLKNKGAGAGRGHVGEGLAGWLAKHCPAIPYKTAMDWKNLAEKSLKKIGGETESALQLMLINDPMMLEADEGEWTEKQLKAREEIYACQTKGALRQMLMPFFGAGTVGRPKEALGETGLTHITDKELCERLWGNVANAFAPIDRLCATVREMDYQRCQYYISTLQNALAALKAHKEKLEG